MKVLARFLTQRRSLRRLSFYFAATALVCLALADIEITSPDPAHELRLMLVGLVTPRIPDIAQWLDATVTTVAYALQGVTIAAALGLVLSVFYQRPWVRRLAAVLRAVHEVFWALLFIQVFGFTPLTGVLAIALPFCGTVAKVFGEQLEEVDRRPAGAVPAPGSGVSHFCYTRLPLALHAMRNYTSYRMECGIRASVVLGFIGLPTLGFHLETALRTGEYSSASALLLTVLALVYSLRFWFRARWLVVLVPAAFIARPITADWDTANLLRFLWECVPAPLRNDWPLEKTLRWLGWLGEQALAGTWNTLLLAQVALVATAVFALLASTLNSGHFVSGWSRRAGDGVLLVLRSLPEYLLNFVFLIVLGPSMLPAAAAITLHNGAIIGHLLGRHSDDVALPPVPAGALGRFAYFYVPTLYQRFLAYCFYRWEIIIRETAMLGVLGIPTLGFYIDSAFQFMRFDVALLLIGLNAALVLAADSLSRRLRRQFLLAPVQAGPPAPAAATGRHALPGA